MLTLVYVYRMFILSPLGYIFLFNGKTFGDNLE